MTSIECMWLYSIRVKEIYYGRWTTWSIVLESHWWHTRKHSYIVLQSPKSTVILPLKKVTNMWFIFRVYSRVIYYLVLKVTQNTCICTSKCHLMHSSALNISWGRTSRPSFQVKYAYLAYILYPNTFLFYIRRLSRDAGGSVIYL
jgi:hypothetical protein